ncbi:histidine phosphatase family protein [Rodentibacter sp. Ppn85]|uniref:histidine phosphatase family protein n=1 Tax=Rodentibacter sp. Ppn85 TaxID=1908525 RepID=UPI000984549B|nr:histidine phosphatase family protein [Rodentibacter sp. Ppn85]OOF64735.1 histidine phosphatase family protein [Rodentibacter sp. Ppn85]
MRLMLLRHGETLWNIEKRLQGHCNSPLSQRGIRQAQAIKPLIQQLSPQLVVCSDLGRTVKTAELIGYTEAVRDPQLRELNMGKWSGLKKSDLIQHQADLYRDWRNGDYTPEDGENWHDFCQRIKQSLLRWAEQSSGDILAVVHSGVIRAACHSLIGLSAAHLLPATQGTLTIFNIKPHSPIKLEAYNLGGMPPDLDVAD